MPPRPAGDAHGAPAATLALIRMAVVLSCLVFAGVTVWMHQSGELTRNPAMARQLGIGVMVVGIAAALGLLVLRRMRDRAPDRARRVTVSIVAWALGEAAALAGIVHYFIVGSADRVWPGALVLVLSLLMFPPPPDRVG